MKSAIICLANGSEELEAISVINILRRAEIKVIIYAKEDFVVCARGTKIIPDVNSLINIDPENLDCMIIPGGLVGVENLSNNNEIIDLINIFKNKAKTIAAICAAPKLLKDNNILPINMVLTSHPSIANIFNEFEYLNDDVVIYDNYITSRGAGTSLDFAFAIVETLLNLEIVEKIKQDICFQG
jgi:DJ-1 family protein